MDPKDLTPIEDPEVSTTDSPTVSSEIPPDAGDPKAEDDPKAEPVKTEPVREPGEGEFIVMRDKEGKITRKITQKDWEAQNAEIHRQQRENAEGRRRSESETAKVQKFMNLMERGTPEAYQQLLKLINHDPEFVKTLPPDVQAELILHQRDIEAEEQGKQKQFVESRRQFAEKVRSEWEEMLANPADFPNVHDYEDQLSEIVLRTGLGLKDAYAVIFGKERKTILEKTWAEREAELRKQLEKERTEQIEAALTAAKTEKSEKSAAAAPAPGGKTPPKPKDAHPPSARQEMTDRIKKGIQSGALVN